MFSVHLVIRGCSAEMQTCTRVVICCFVPLLPSLFYQHACVRTTAEERAGNSLTGLANRPSAPFEAKLRFFFLAVKIPETEKKAKLKLFQASEDASFHCSRPTRFGQSVSTGF